MYCRCWQDLSHLVLVTCHGPVNVIGSAGLIYPQQQQQNEGFAEGNLY